MSHCVWCDRNVAVLRVVVYGSAIRSDGGLKQEWVKVKAFGKWNAFVWAGVRCWIP